MPTGPPSIARWNLIFFADRTGRNALIGDLEEEFEQHFDHSSRSVRVWYWKQALFSLPHLLEKCINSACGVQSVSVLIASFLAYVPVRIWDVSVATNAAVLLMKNVDDLSLVIVRIIYVMMMTGLMFGGAFIAATIFNYLDSFRRNIFCRLIPASLTTIIFYMLYLPCWSRSDLLHLMVGMTLAVLSLLCGTFVVNR